MFSKGQIVIISDRTYRVSDSIRGTYIGFHWHEGPRYESAKKYFPAENIFPYNDIENEKEPIIIDDKDAIGNIICVLPQHGSQDFIELIRNQMRISHEFRYKLHNEWIKIGIFEYKITYAYGSERMNLIYRKPGDIGPIYNILYTDYEYEF